MHLGTFVRRAHHIQDIRYLFIDTSVKDNLQQNWSTIHQYPTRLALKFDIGL